MSEPTQPADVSVVEAWSAVMADCRKVGKDSVNTAKGQGGYKFRGIDAVMNAAGPAMRAHGVIVTPHRIRSIDYTTVTVGQNQTVMASVRVLVTYRVRGPMGDHFDATVPGEAFDSGDKGTAKAMSVAYRTMLLQSLTLPTDDADPDADSYQRSGHDTSAAETADLGRWRGLVAACGRDQGKMRALWQTMVAEWDATPWSPERQAILEAAIEAAKRPAEPAQARPAPPPADEPRPADDPNEAAAVADWDQDWRDKLAAAVESRNATQVRALIKIAAEAKAPELKAEGMAALDAFRTGA